MELCKEIRRKLRVAGYGRVSSDKEDQVNSLESQRRYFKEYINAHEDWILVDVYYDEGISGTQTKNRDGFNTMIEDALRGEIEIKLAYLIQRIGTEYLKNRRNKGFRHIGCDRKPFSFCGNLHFCEMRRLKVNPPHRQLNPPYLQI